MKACIDALPNANSIAYFDTSFHCSMPQHIGMYAIQQDIAKKRGLKKYGFHGLSCTLPTLLYARDWYLTVFGITANELNDIIDTRLASGRPRFTRR